VAPDFHLGIGRALETEQLKREDNPLKEKLLGADAAQDHHAVTGVSVSASGVRQTNSGFRAPINPLMGRGPW
jgi:hypothetical protein